eukprot:CAMPEP_0201513850 /NCGR_PEP_ID=MMETSP0161_2-20130828/5813_1 /ASSEMBLY_ACC=CAM_ASM_000251 /TAXON_ID=180227 /ORGANISM="Neoparamoeba aestuarina, Strain SoJaBio B1-5/56/2" /LENGTH=452 /DNA_ID=CAMNT_0047910223 /DNA_START=97 /DNA_END=1455 /DNA_ORIENTATION=+
MASDVLELTGANFDQALKDNKVMIVKFYAPWCGHCKSLAPIWEEVATDLKDEGIAVAKVDVTIEEGLGQRYQIQGFPTLKFFKNGKESADYKGARTADAITAFLKKKSGAPFTVVNSFEEAEQILADEKYGVVVGHFAALAGDAFEDFAAIADGDEAIKYLVISDAASAEACELTQSGAVFVLDKDGKKHHFSEDLDLEDDLASFVKQNAYPQTMELNPDLFQVLMPGNIIIVSAFDTKGEGAEEHTAMVTEVVKNFPVKQMITDSNKWGNALVRMGVVSGEVYPTFVAFDGRGERKAPISWHEDVAVDKEGFQQWVSNVIDGTQTPWMKSEPIPESNNGPVKVIVQKQWQELVGDNTKDVLVEFYAPWCGHCKNLAPIYESLGEHFVNDDNIVISKMDATANYVDPLLSVQGFPTIKFFPAGAKNDVVSYEGDRTLEDLIEFVNTNRNSQA